MPSEEASKFYVRLASGAHQSLFAPDNAQAETFAQMFYHQALLVEVPHLPGRTTVEQLTIKSSSVSTEGLLIAPVRTDAFKSPIRNLNDMSLSEAHHLFTTVGSCIETGQHISRPAFTLFHVNFSQEPQFRDTTEVARGKRQTVPLRASQTIGTLHAHVDFFTPEELGTLVRNPAELALAAGSTQVEHRRQFAPHPLTRIAQAHFQSELAPRLLREYPELFEPVDPSTRRPDHPTDPAMSLQVKSGVAALSTIEFAQAAKLIQSESARVWNEYAALIRSAHDQPDQAESLLQDFASRHPYLNDNIGPGSRTHLDVLRNLAQLAKGRAVSKYDPPEKYEHNRNFWLQYNGTLGVAHWQGRKPILFLDIRPNTGSGIQSAGMIVERKPEAPSETVHLEQMLWRQEFMTDFRHRHPNEYTLGPEGEGTLKLTRGITTTYEEAHQMRLDLETHAANKAQPAAWPTTIPTQIQEYLVLLSQKS